VYICSIYWYPWTWAVGLNMPECLSKWCWYLYSAYLVGCIVWYSGILSSVVIQPRWSIHSFCTVCEYAHVHWWAFTCYVLLLCCKWVLMLTECTYFTVIYLFIVLIFYNFVNFSWIESPTKLFVKLLLNWWCRNVLVPKFLML